MNSQEQQQLLELITSQVPSQHWTVRIWGHAVRVAKHYEVKGHEGNPPVVIQWFIASQEQWNALYDKFVCNHFDVRWYVVDRKMLTVEAEYLTPVEAQEQIACFEDSLMVIEAKDRTALKAKLATMKIV